VNSPAAEPAREGLKAHYRRWTHSRLLALMRRDSGLSVILAIQASIMFVVAPLAATGLWGPGVSEVFRFGLAAAAVLMITRSRPIILLIAATFVLSLVLAARLRTGLGADAVYLGQIAFTTTFDTAVSIAVARVAFGPGRVTVHRIMGGVILYLSVGLIFANIYRVAALLLHPSFSGLPTSRRAALSQMLYFSLSTLTTTGFGDVTPLHPFVRSLANLESVIGQLYPATLLARLVTLHAAGESKTFSA
jgi:hypothetical protein